MPTVEFDIEHLYPDDTTGGIVLSVELQAGNSTRLLAHVDTGAANCLFQSDYADILGLTLTDGIPKNFPRHVAEASPDTVIKLPSKCWTIP